MSIGKEVVKVWVVIEKVELNGHALGDGGGCRGDLAIAQTTAGRPDRREPRILNREGEPIGGWIRELKRE